MIRQFRQFRVFSLFRLFRQPWVRQVLSNWIQPAAMAGVCCAVLPLPQIGPRVARALSGVM